MKQLTELPSWSALYTQAELLRINKVQPLSTYLEEDACKLSLPGISVDFSHQRINDTALQLLFDLAKESRLHDKISALLQGAHVNSSEDRPALHTALRAPEKSPSIYVDGDDIMPAIIAARQKMQAIATQIRQQQWLGYNGKPINAIVNIGLGGSDLGPRLCIHALRDYADKQLTYRFVSDVDPASFSLAVEGLNPETTLFLISSKTFTTRETLYNANKAIAWMGQTKPHPQHFIAITANQDLAAEFGAQHILPIWPWVGGRYSLCSAINLITCIAVGFEHFSAILQGAHSVDMHFKTADFPQNIPVLMALLGIWNINCLDISNLLCLVYTNRLEKFVAYLQQLDMESNGKSIDKQGKALRYSTGPIVWGGIGNQAQHSYYQLLCQGTHRVTADFISLKIFDHEMVNEFCRSKMQVLNRGIDTLSTHSMIAGGMPFNHIELDECTPTLLGSLIALYEHKVYSQSILWNINAFDQPGVESAKRLVCV